MGQRQSQSHEFLADNITDSVSSTLQNDFNPLKSKPKCSKCKKLSSFACLRCGDFYCSDLCQNLDWPDHRKVCVAKPPLVNINDQNNRISKDSMQQRNQFRLLASVCEDFADELQIALKNSKDNVSINFNNEGTQTFSSTQETIEDELVIMACFATLNKVFVYPKNYNDAYQDVLAKVDEYGKRAPSLKKTPLPNSLVISRRKGKYCRAKVLTVSDGNPELIRIHFIDFGNYAFRQLHELCEITLAIADLPIYVAGVKLKNISNYMVSSCVWQSILNTFERKTYRMETDACNETELFEVNTGQSINDIIISIINNQKVGKQISGVLLPNKENNMEITNHKKSNVDDQDPVKAQLKATAALAPVMNPPFKTNIIQRTERNVKAVLVDSSIIEYGYVACLLLKHLKEFIDIQNYLKQKPLKNAEPYVPKCGEYVIAEFQDKWYRGQVVGVEPDGDHFEIFFVDFLKQAVVSSHKIRYYPIDLTIDCNTQLCALSGLPKTFTPDIKKFLKNEIKAMDMISIDRVVDIHEEVVHIECRQILERMLEKNLI